MSNGDRRSPPRHVINEGWLLWSPRGKSNIANIVYRMSEELEIRHVLWGSGSPRSDFPEHIVAQPQIIMLQRGLMLMEASR